jgi:hypothetical protein
VPVIYKYDVVREIPMSDLLKRQIDVAMHLVRARESNSKDIIDRDGKEQYEKDTLLMRIDCLKGLQWLRNCRE